MSSLGIVVRLAPKGCATPEGLFSLFKNRATTTANPYVLRQAETARGLTTASVVQKRLYQPPPLSKPKSTSARASSAPPMRSAELAPIAGSVRGTSGLRVLSPGTAYEPLSAPPIGLTLHSLDFRR